MKVLFVCTGNTCRSPMAEGILRHLSEQQKQKVDVLSAGIAAFPGDPPSVYAQEVMREHHIDISDHRSRRLRLAHLHAADWVVTMTSAHAQMILNEYPEGKGKIVTLSQWSGLKGDIEDPYGGTKEAYERCAEEIEKKIEAAWKKFSNDTIS